MYKLIINIGMEIHIDVGEGGPEYYVDVCDECHYLHTSIFLSMNEGSK